MEFFMKWRFPIILGITVLAIYAGVKLKNRCTEPADVDVQIMVMSCVIQFTSQDNATIRDRFCKYIEQEPGCQPGEEYRPKFMEMFNSYVKECSNALLKIDNFCPADKQINDLLKDI